MKKATAKKVSKKASPNDSKKKRSYVSDMMRRDMESCIEKDKELAKAGVQKPKKDIYKDDPCYGCKYAIANKNVRGPFDRRFKCNGYSRIVNELEKAIEIIRDKKELLHGQQGVLFAAALIGERVANGHLECVNTTGKPSCFVGADLDEYLNAK